MLAVSERRDECPCMLRVCFIGRGIRQIYLPDRLDAPPHVQQPTRKHAAATDNTHERLESMLFMFPSINQHLTLNMKAEVTFMNWLSFSTAVCPTAIRPQIKAPEQSC